MIERNVYIVFCIYKNATDPLSVKREEFADNFIDIKVKYEVIVFFELFNIVNMSILVCTIILYILFVFIL